MPLVYVYLNVKSLVCTLYVFLSVSLANNNCIFDLNKILENKLQRVFASISLSKKKILLFMVISTVLNTHIHMRFECRHNMLQIVLLRPHPASISIHARTIAEFASVCLCYDKTANKWNYCLRRQYNQCPTLIIIIYNITEHVFFHTIPSRGQLWAEVLVAHIPALYPYGVPHHHHHHTP